MLSARGRGDRSFEPVVESSIDDFEVQTEFVTWFDVDGDGREELTVAEVPDAFTNLLALEVSPL
ncbi:MAG: hypothetical protein AAF591_20555, partial [Verrucomicrobiota bacterium]